MPETEHAYTFLALSTTKTRIKQQAWNQWNHELITKTTYLDRAQLNEKVRLFIPDKPIRSLKFPKLCNYFTTQFITAHGSFALYKERFQITKNGHKNCPQCTNHEDSPEHALFYCLENRDLQDELIEDGIRNKNDLKKIVLETELIETFKRVCEIIINRRKEIQ